MSVKEDGGTVGVFSPKRVSQVIFICLRYTFCQSSFKGAVTFTVSQMKSSHFYRNSSIRIFACQYADFTTGSSWSRKFAGLLTNKNL